MRIDIITIFPKMFAPVLNESITKRAQSRGKVSIHMHDLRDYTADKHRKVDDRPYGGGAGMVMSPQPIYAALKALQPKASLERKKTRIVLCSPRGKKLTQAEALRLSKYRHLIVVCGRYEGVDERVAQHLVDEEISIGDYILTGGELPAMVLVDCITRLVPGVLGDKNSLHFESFKGNLLEYPHYTRPAEFRGWSVPEVLRSGDHRKIASWRKKQALRTTQRRRPDLIKKVT